VIDKSASRRGFLQHMTALGALGGASAGFAASDLRAAEPRLIAQAQPGAASAPLTRAFETAETGGLPRIQLMIGPGTLPSVGKDRMDLLRYRLSGNPRLTGEQMLEPLPEIAKVARVEVDKGNPYAQATHEDLRKLALRVEEVLQSPDVGGLVYVQGTTRSKKPRIS
jgi:hypothetical protein